MEHKIRSSVLSLQSMGIWESSALPNQKIKLEVVSTGVSLHEKGMKCRDPRAIMIIVNGRPLWLNLLSEGGERTKPMHRELTKGHRYLNPHKLLTIFDTLLKVYLVWTLSNLFI